MRPGGSDSATLDNVLELLVLAGRSPAARDDDDGPGGLRGPRRPAATSCKAFYAFHSCFMEPWDGPAAVAFTDGRVIGATLDRNGLRPGRWLETKDGWVILGSEAGMLERAGANIARKGRLAPGKLFLVDLEAGPDRPRRRGQAARSRPAALRRLVRAGRRAPRRPARARRRRRSTPARSPTASSPSAGRRRTCA